MSVFFTRETLILYIKDTINMLGWKLWPLPANTVPRHIHWQGINVKFGMLLRPKCWQLIQIWCTHTHAHIHTHTHTHTHTHITATLTAEWACVVQHGLTMWIPLRTRHGCLATYIWMDICGRKRRKIWCENTTTDTIWIMILHVKARPNICKCTRNTQTHSHITRESNAFLLIIKTTINVSLVWSKNTTNT